MVTLVARFPAHPAQASCTSPTTRLSIEVGFPNGTSNADIVNGTQSLLAAVALLQAGVSSSDSAGATSPLPLCVPALSDVVVSTPSVSGRQPTHAVSVITSVAGVSDQSFSPTASSPP